MADKQNSAPEGSAPESEPSTGPDTTETSTRIHAILTGDQVELPSYPKGSAGAVLVEPIEIWMREVTPGAFGRAGLGNDHFANKVNDALLILDGIDDAELQRPVSADNEDTLYSVFMGLMNNSQNIGRIPIRPETVPARRAALKGCIDHLCA